MRQKQNRSSNLVLPVILPAGQLKEKQFFEKKTQYNGGIGTPSEQQTFTYDAFGRIVSTQVMAVVGQSLHVTLRRAAWRQPAERDP